MKFEYNGSLKELQMNWNKSNLETLQLVEQSVFTIEITL